MDTGVLAALTFPAALLDGQARVLRGNTAFADLLGIPTSALPGVPLPALSVRPVADGEPVAVASLPWGSHGPMIATLETAAGTRTFQLSLAPFPLPAPTASERKTPPPVLLTLAPLPPPPLPPPPLPAPPLPAPPACDEEEVSAKARLADRLAGLGHWEWRAETGRLLLCAALRDLLAWPPGRAITPLGLARRVPAEDRVLVWRALRRVRDGAEILRLTCRVCLPDGSERHLRALGLPRRDPQGRLRGLCGVGQDVTRQVEGALALATSETRYRGILESAGDPIVLHDGQGRIVDANPQATLTLGHSLDALRRMSVFDLDTTASRSDLLALWAGMVPGEPITVQGSHRRRDGTDIPVEVRIGVFVNAGERWFVAIARDITERQRLQRDVTLAAERFRAIFELNLIGVGVLDAGRRWLQVNEVLLGLLGRERTELIGRPWSAVLDGEDRPREEHLWRDLRRDGRSSYAIDAHLRDARGRKVPVRLSMGAAFGRDGTPNQHVLLVQDLTERRAWEAAKAQSEARLRSLINATTDAIALLDPDGTVRVLNRAGGRLLGTTARQALGRSFFAFLERAHAVTYRHLLHDVLATQIPANREDLWNGRWMDVVVFPVLDGDGKPMGLTLYARDITRRRETEQRLKDNEARLRGAFDGAVHGIALISLYGGLMRVNAALCRILDRDAPSLLTSDQSVLGQAASPSGDDLDAMIAGQRGDCSVERAFTRADGRSGWIHIAGSMVRAEDDTALYFVVHVQDITQRRQAEERARTAESHLLEAAALMSDGMLLFDENFRLVMHNPAYLRAMPEVADLIRPGIHHDEIARFILDNNLLLAPEGQSPEDVIEAIRAPGSGEGNHPAHDYVRPDGRCYLVRSIRTRAGYTLMMGSDITDMKMRERTLASAKEAAELANRAKSEFLANMSHELRTPLNAVIGFSDIIQNGMFGAIGNPVYAEYARRIHEAGLHLLDIISDILDLSKIEAGELTLEETAVDLCLLGEETLQMLASRAELKTVRLTNAISPHLPLLWSDALRVKQVIINLMTNAVKYTPEGGRVTLGANLTSTGSLTVSVTDTGIGMDEEGIRVALTPFGQVESAYTRKQGGTGLGLPLTVKLMKAHGGELRIDSAPGSGTRVTAIFPPHRTRRLEKRGGLEA